MQARLSVREPCPDLDSETIAGRRQTYHDALMLLKAEGRRDDSARFVDGLTTLERQLRQDIPWLEELLHTCPEELHAAIVSAHERLQLSLSSLQSAIIATDGMRDRLQVAAVVAIGAMDELVT